MMTPLSAHMSVDLPLRLRVQSIINEWRKGCSSPAGECLACSNGALMAIEDALLREATPALDHVGRRKALGL